MNDIEMKKQIQSYIQKEKDDFIRDYKTIVESPSISSSKEHKKDILQTAQLAMTFLKARGFNSKLYETKGNPVVVGSYVCDPKAPTIGIYNHLDVQPATKGQDGWTMDPFVFQEKNGRFYSRGTTDDKGPAMTALWAASIAKRLGIKCNIEFIWELEEEIGSPNFKEFVLKAKNDIRSQSILVSDSIWVSNKQPAISMALRGLVSMIVKLKTAQKDVHSGLTGGAARNPLAEMCEVIAKCVDAKTGNILVEGFEGTWEKASPKELEDFKRSGFDVNYFKEAHGLTHLRTENALDIMERIWAKPTFEVHGIKGGYQGDGVKTVVPPYAEGKISCRLVMGQDPQRVFDLVKKHIQKINPMCEIELEGILEPYSTRIDHPLVEEIIKAEEFGFGKKPVLVREGGSIGAVLTMDKILNVPIMFMGLSLPEDGYHGPDESFAWAQIEGGVQSFVKYFDLISKA